MGGDDLKVGVRIRKLVIKTTKFCYRSVRNHPFAVGILLFLLILYRSSPFLFSLLVSASPVLVCTAVLLGTLLSFGDPNIALSVEEEEKDEKVSGLKMSRVENPLVVEEDELLGSRFSKFEESRREIDNLIDEEPLLDNFDKIDDFSEKDHADIDFSSMHNDQLSREVRLEKQGFEEAKREVENNEDKDKEIKNTEIEQVVDLGDQLIRTRDEVDLSDGGSFQNRVSTAEEVRAGHFEDLMSLESRKGFDEVRGDSLSTIHDVQRESLEDYISAEGSLDGQVMDQLEPSLASWKQFDELDDGLSPTRDVQDERFENQNLVEESYEGQMRDHLESSLRSWERFGSDHDEYDQSDSGSDGAESSSPDASMTDIIPMLHELDPLLEDEIPMVGDLSRQNSAVKSHGGSIHSDDASDQKEDDGDDGKSEAEDDNEDDSQSAKEDPDKSAIMWTEDDEKNLMDLGTSEMERNQRLESLIARRRARKMAGDRNLMDLEGMDLPFPVAPISTRKNNPFDFPHDSYDDLGLPPIPGSAPSVMLKRRNPFDLPYDSSEEKPDLTGDSFQQEFMELNQREAYNPREALFRRNETFNLGSSAFDFGRPSRFRPYFIPERTDSDGMSYSSLSRQFSELSESKASSAGETESTFVGLDPEEKKLVEHDSALEVEPSSEIDQASLLVEHGSQSCDDLDSLSDNDKDKTDSIQSLPEVELGGAISQNEDGNDIQLTPKLLEVEDVSSCSVNREQSQINDALTVEVPVKYSLELSVSDVTTGQSLKSLEHSATVAAPNYPMEPIYDFSPLKNSQSLSSSSSDIQRETSGIDIYHLTRDLFVAEETSVDNKDTESISQHKEQEADENCSRLNDFGEGSGLNSTEFSKLNQLPDNSQASVVDEDAGYFSKDLAERGFEDNLLISNDKVSLGEDDDSSSDDTISSGGLEFLEESVLIQERNEVDVSSENALPGESLASYSTGALEEELGVEMEVNQQSRASSLQSHEYEKEISRISLDENLCLPHDSNIDENNADSSEQESSIIQRELKEFEELNKVDEYVNFLQVQKPQHDNMSDPFQTSVSSSQPDESVTIPIAEVTIEDHAHELSETIYACTPEENYKISEDFRGSIADELVIHEKTGDIEEMDETLLSELDVVGDFGAPIMVPISKNSDTPAEVLGQVYSNNKSHTETIVSETGDSSIDSLAGDVSTDFLVLEAQSVSYIDAAFKRVSEELRNSADSKSFHAESSGNEVANPIPERELMSEEDTEPDKTQPEAALLEGHNLDSSMRSIDSGMPVWDAMVFERSGEDVERVAEDDTSDVIESTVQDIEQKSCVSDLAFLEEQNLYSDTREVDSGMPILDTTVIERSGEDVENIAEANDTSGVISFNAESTGKDVEVPIPKTESMTEEDTEQEKRDFEDTEPEMIQTDLDLLEGQNLDSNRRAIDSDEQSGENAEKVVEDDTSDVIECFHGESIGKKVEAPIPERELSMSEEDTEQETCVSEDKPEGLQPELDISEGRNLIRREVDAEMPVLDSMIIGEDVEKSADEDDASDVAESSHVDSVGKEVEVCIPERESMSEEDTEPERIQPDLDLLEGHNLDSNRRENDSGMKVMDTVIIEQSGENVAEEDDTSNVVESPKTVPETGIDNVKFLPSIDEEKKELDESPLVEECTLAHTPRDQTESVGCIDLDSSRIDRDIEGTHESLLLLDAETPLPLESGNGEEMLKVPVHVASIEHAAESEYETVKNTSESSLLDKNEATHELESESEDQQREVIKLSEPLEQDINVPGVQQSPAPELSVEKEKVQSLESDSLKVDEESEMVQDSSLLEASIGSSLDVEENMVGSSESEPLLMHDESEKIQDPNTLQAGYLESEEKDIAGCLESEPVLSDEEREKTQYSPIISASVASSPELEVEKTAAGSLEPEPLQEDSLVEELREWHIVEESSSLAVESGDHIERTSSMDSYPLQNDADIEKVQYSPEYGDKIMTFSPGESGPVMIDSNIGKLPDLSDVNERTTPPPPVESEGRLERFYSVSVDFESFLKDGDPKEIQESLVPQTSCLSSIEFEDQLEMNSQIADQLPDEVIMPHAESEIRNDSSMTVAQTSNHEVDQRNTNSTSENHASQVEETSHESHLEFSSSSSSSSSSGTEKD
ncbi:unnamed protein product [Amaranthus hypochondriacus]